MNAHETPSGTRMMWKASVNAICARAQGTGSTLSVPRAWTAAFPTTSAPSRAYRSHGTFQCVALLSLISGPGR